ncbi:MAG: hypothetical protein FJ098_06200 [Deltaproteobacteria bacterium]|nr:hypothetical protein [Deltaproteobacteria bacterium]
MSCLCLVLCLVAGAAAAEEAGTIRMTPVKVISYAGGLSWVVAEGRGEPDLEGRVRVGEPASVVEGSLHVGTRDGGALRSVVVSRGDPVEADAGRVLRITLEKPGNRVHLTMEWITRQVSWRPIYRLDVTDPKKAMLRMDAELQNELDHLAGTEVSLATATLATAGWQGDPSVTPDPFLYGPLEVDLRRGERGLYPLLDREVSCREVFLLEVTDDDVRGRNAPRVRRSLRFENSTPGPLAEGLVTVVAGSRPLGQGRIAHTPPADEARIVLGPAAEVDGRVSESLVDRFPAAARVGERLMDRHTMDGVISLRNTTTRKVRVHVERRLAGTLRRADRQARVRTLPAGDGDANPVTVLSWDLELPAAGDAELTYRHRVLWPAE